MLLFMTSFVVDLGGSMFQSRPWFSLGSRCASPQHAEAAKERSCIDLQCVTGVRKDVSNNVNT